LLPYTAKHIETRSGKINLASQPCKFYLWMLLSERFKSQLPWDSTQIRDLYKTAWTNTTSGEEKKRGWWWGK